MSEKLTQQTRDLMNERFHHDSLIALATVENGQPWVRTVNAYYEDGAFYVLTHALSSKMRQIAHDPHVAVCGDWFTAHGIADDLGAMADEGNAALLAKLRTAFSSWYNNGHTDESDPNSRILRVRLTDGVLLSHGTRYEIDFTGEPVWER